jgi:hypothetical protein
MTSNLSIAAKCEAGGAGRNRKIRRLERHFIPKIPCKDALAMAYPLHDDALCC